LNGTKKISGKLTGILLVVFMVLSLTGCKVGVPAVTDAPETTSAAEAAVQETTAAQIADAAELIEAAASAAEPKKLFETTQVSAGLVDILEDTEAYHMIVITENKTDKELNLEITAVAFNGITAENSSGVNIPASGNAYLYMSFYKENLSLAGITGIPGTVKLGFSVYNTDYDKIDEGIAECVLDGANSKPAEVPEGEVVYQENDLVITSLGVTGETADDRKLMLCLENNTEDLILINGGAAMAPGEALYPSIYAYVLPGTKAVTSCGLTNTDYSVNIDPAGIPFADIIFRIEKNSGSEAFQTEPVKIELGEEKRFKISEDGKSLEIYQEYWMYDECEWTVTSSWKDSMTVESVNVEENVPAEGYQKMTAVLKAGAPGDITVSLKYHPVGADLEAAEDYWPTVYCARELSFRVTEDGTIEPGDVWLEIPNLTEEGDNSSWYYILRKDGSVAAKNDAAG